MAISHVLFSVCLILTYYVPSSVQSSEVNQDALKNSFESFSYKFAEAVAKSQPGKNFITSPLNVYAALLLAVLGSKGETQTELVKALELEQFSDNLDDVHKSIGNLFKEAQNSNYSTLNVADAVFVNSKIQINDHYKQNAKSYYGSVIESLDFSDGGQHATDTVNQWVSNQTNGRIPKLYEERIDPETVSLLASALYFKAEWENQFPTQMTKKSTFHGFKSNVEIDFMETVKVVSYYSGAKYDAIAIPYKKRESFCYYVLPKANETLDTIFKSFNLDEFRNILHKSYNRFTDYTVPKLKLKFSKELSDVVRKLGVEKAFDRSKADFSELGVNAFIDKIVHKTELETTEYGTIGSAATSIDAVEMMMPFEFTVNRPFAQFIYHPKSKCILFIGCVYDPLEG